MYSLLITGGTGFFGKAILRKIKELKKTYQIGTITIISRNPDSFIRKYSKVFELRDIDFLKADITNKDELKNIQDCYTHILHAATESSNGPAIEPEKRFNDINEGTKNVLDLAEEFDKPRVLYVSSGGVYGEQFDSCTIREDQNISINPGWVENAYSIAKLQGEHLLHLKSYNKKMIPIVARCFSFVGQDLPQDKHFAVGNFIKNVDEEKNIIIKGDGSAVRSYMHQNSLVDVLFRLLFDKKISGTFNVGSSEPISIEELAKYIKNISGKDIQVEILGGIDITQSKKRTYYVPDTEKIKKLMPDINFEQTYSSISLAMKETLK